MLSKTQRDAAERGERLESLVVTMRPTCPIHDPHDGNTYTESWGFGHEDDVCNCEAFTEWDAEHRVKALA